MSTTQHFHVYLIGETNCKVGVKLMYKWIIKIDSSSNVIQRNVKNSFQKWKSTKQKLPSFDLCIHRFVIWSKDFLFIVLVCSIDTMFLCDKTPASYNFISLLWNKKRPHFFVSKLAFDSIRFNSQFVHGV